jgi:4-amino-4-deoxy-L-arabinose transferase
VFLGLGFLAKGHIVSVHPAALPDSKIFDIPSQGVHCKTGRHRGSGFLCRRAAWYILVVVQNPSLLNYFLSVQTAERFATTRFYREEPFWFLWRPSSSPLLPGLFVLKGAFKVRGMPTVYKVLFLYILVPFLVFTLSKSKLATYILPFYGTASVLAAYVIRTYPAPL